MKVLQILPELNSGGVERGTVEFARHLVQEGHTSLVMSAGGRMVAQLEREGSQHIVFPIHKKSLGSLFKVPALRRLLKELDVDVIHVRSRVPAWMTWLAIKKWPRHKRPALVSTFHGLYSVSPYSAIMGCGDQVIAISRCVQDYIVKNYPRIDPGKITLIHRGVDTQQFHTGHQIPKAWLDDFYAQHPQLRRNNIILMPGRLSRWKGQPEFIAAIGKLIERGVDCHGLIVGNPTPGKERYLEELKQQVKTLQLESHITFLGHSDQMPNIYSLSAAVCNLSRHPEPFGRTIIEALALGTPVVSYDYGGPAESLRDCYPQGLVPVNDQGALLETLITTLREPGEIHFAEQFTLQHQAEATLTVYRKALACKAVTAD